MVKKLFAFVMLFSLLVVGACSNSITEEVDVYEMVSFSEIRQDTLRTFTEFESVTEFVKGFANAKRELGIVDISDPSYQVEFDGKSYFLWKNEDQGTIMNSKDAHTIYTLSKESAKNIYDLLSS